MAKRSRFAFMARKSRECVEEAFTPAETDPEIRRMMVSPQITKALSRFKGSVAKPLSPVVARLHLRGLR